MVWVEDSDVLVGELEDVDSDVGVFDDGACWVVGVDFDGWVVFLEDMGDGV